MRASPSSSMQKTYDECFLTCSTAVYFESQNNEAEALRSWKTALDQIYYHNAHRVPSNYRPKSETEKALQDSLHQLELQCKERVDLLEALKRSREEANDSLASPPPSADAIPTPPPPIPEAPNTPNDTNGRGWLGGGTVPPVDYTDIYRPPLPHRPALQSRKSSGTESSRIANTSQTRSGLSLSPGPTAPSRDSRTPSPEKKSRMLRTLRPGGREGSRTSSSMMPSSMRSRPLAAAKAATQAWGTSSAPISSRPAYFENHSSKESVTASQHVTSRTSLDRPRSEIDSERAYTQPPNHESYQPQAPLYFRSGESSRSAAYAVPPPNIHTNSDTSKIQISPKDLPSPPLKRNSLETSRYRSNQGNNTGGLAYRNEYPNASLDSRTIASSATARSWTDLESDKLGGAARDGYLSRQSPLCQSPSTNNRARKTRKSAPHETVAVGDNDDAEHKQTPHCRKLKDKDATVRPDLLATPTSEADKSNCPDAESDEWKERVRGIMKNLPKGVDPSVAQQILNEIMIHGDEVHWDDVVGLEVAKSALKETVVYPFLRPDLFVGLREPARGMLLFGPPGTGKTMLARAVATESKSTFFAISASSLTSKFLGESEKLVRALFALAKMLAPSIIFVDEIDSLLSARSGSGEHEATRRIKTEFLIQWSDLAKAAAGREQSDRDKERRDASRVLVLAATNLPWAIDEAARRRFVRRQYIPLPEDHVRKLQLKTLLRHQQHELSDEGIDSLVRLTEGFSGSDITALAKDAAMGPLRSLGEKLLHMTMDEIRPITFEDFSASLSTIKASVSKQGLKEFEDWARVFGERGG
ncbi:AAA-domain-containing protein [Zopfia rhizophila CBS 207.26]|uniref:AAA-domain-containing protein n=1 Tax=Zopfia rhizophila CBS 207.26 TaxID=1314779 RepID=A0A6A6DB44_9PEZI|nr:AAA-domain-containing protein [Zopfia rhizophila CBS 207.26]